MGENHSKYVMEIQKLLSLNMDSEIRQGFKVGLNGVREKQGTLLQSFHNNRLKRNNTKNLTTAYCC
jgi:hypothetical protein